MNLTFCGGVRGVTGSCYFIETKTHKLLIDCGMYQGEGKAERQVEDFNFDPAKIDAVILTHAHYDHCGRLPVLAQKGFRGKIFCTPPTKALSHLILKDSQHVMVENNHKKDTPILFTTDDVEMTDELMHVMNYHTEFEPVPGIKVMLHDVGHILGSAFVSLIVAAQHTKDGEKKTFVFSGDVGNDNVPILPDTELIERADVIVLESTYGNREHETAEVKIDKLKTMIDRVIGRGGTLIIPAFSIERTQELLYELDRLTDAGEIPSVPIYLDSPMAIRATEMYQHFSNYLRFDRNIFSSPDKDFFSFPNLHVTLSVDDSKRINDNSQAKIIIAGSGMMTGGRVMHHLQRYIEDPKAGILIIGYQAQGTLGRRIFNKEPKVRIYRDQYEVKAEVAAIGGFSAHADRIKLRKWAKPKQGGLSEIYLVHGDKEAKEEFKPYLEQETDAKVLIPQFWQQFEF
ncbi:MBL fold metallo-hydrolase [Candidatus Uhrbacteria bacterium]|jgi:metallo-beta-lactamase family protein|nr:MBL fold metallo-hydrolase [Candidatus Uhrbacteria bacterium]